jgi:hypothetical protein
MTVPARVIELLEEGRAAIRGAAKFEFGGGTYGVTTNGASFVHGGVTYVANQLVQIDAPAAVLGLEASEFTVTMPSASDFGLTPDKLAEIENEDYKGRPVTVYDVFFDPDTRELLYLDPIAYGYLDTIDHERDGSGEMKLTGHVISGALDNHRDGYRAASHEDQQLVSPGDMFFEHAGRVKSETFDIEL